MAFIKINGQELEVANGTTILEAANSVALDIPHYCYHKGLSIVASCRMCLVKVEGMPKLTPACSTRIGEMPPERKVDGKYDMVVDTISEEVEDAQESVLEFLLLNHPVDCPECDQAGECKLQDYTFQYGKDHSRFQFPKRVPPRKDLGPNMLLIATRCILCTRCVRFTKEVTGSNELMVRQRGYHAEIDLFPDQSLDNKMSMNTADICPVGALVTKDFLFKPRNWRYQKTQSVCPGCSVGCNISIEHLEEDNRIYRIKPVENQQVNQWWMCDEGRLLYHQYDNLERIEYPGVRQNDTLIRSSWQKAYKAAQAQLRQFDSEAIAVIGSGFATNEANYLLQLLARKALKTQNVYVNDHYSREDDIVYAQFTINGDKVPNMEGARDMLKPVGGLSDLVRQIEDGKVKAVYFLGGDPNFSPTDEQLAAFGALDFLMVQDIRNHALAKAASVLLAGASAYEKDGTFTNCKGHVQRLKAAVLPPAAAKTDFEIISELLDTFEHAKFLRPKKAFAAISEAYPDYAGMSYENLGSQGCAKGKSVEAAPVNE